MQRKPFQGRKGPSERALQQKESREANLHELCIWQQQPAVEQVAGDKRKTAWTHRCPTNSKGHPMPHLREQAPERKGIGSHKQKHE
jgi:hypothetical protein